MIFEIFDKMQSYFIPRISGEQIIWGGEIMVAAFGGGQLELQKFQFMIGRGFPSITKNRNQSI